MSNQQSSMVHLFGGKMASAEELEAYLTGCYDEDGEYVPSVFEEEFELDLDPDFLEMEWFEETCSDLQSLLSGFSYDNQLIAQFSNKLQEALNSLVLVYESNETPNGETDGQLTYLGTATYYR